MRVDEVSASGWARGLRERDVEQRVREAVGEIAAEGKAPSFYQVAERAKVARSTLYRKPELRALVEEARWNAAAALGDSAGPSASLKVSAAPCSDLAQENCRLKQEVKNLSAQCDLLSSKPQRAAPVNLRPQITYYVLPLSPAP